MAKINRITFRLDDDLAERIEAEAARQRRTVSDLARLMLDESLPPLRAEMTQEAS